MLVAIGFFGFWLTNFLPHPNGEPIFINLACQRDTTTLPTWEMNNSCSLTQDMASTEVWTDTILSVDKGRGRGFSVPGVPEWEESPGSFQHPPIAIRGTCKITLSNLPTYSMRIFRAADYDIGRPAVEIASGTFESGEPCQISGEITGLGVDVPGEGYRIEIVPEPGSEISREAEFTIEVDTYDGVPEMMNNKSKFLGPEINTGIISLRPFNFLNWFAFGMFTLLFPASFYWDRVQKKTEAMENKFPDFLRDLAEYWKGGLSMTVAVQTLTTAEYGALNDEVKKMSDQISWGVAFENVLLLFADRVGTPLVRRAISLICEANRAGGKISDILVTAANDTREIKFLEQERIRAIASYKAVIWTSYFVFLGVIVVLAKVFIPAIASSNSSGESESIGAMTIKSVEPLFFLTVFFYGVTMQAVGNGAMAGIMATGRISSGFRISGMMILVALLSFNLVAFSPDLMGVPIPRGLSPDLGGYETTAFVGG